MRRKNMKSFKKIVKLLTKRKEMLATMESCTGGGVANAITCVEGASEVFAFSAVTYSNDFKIKMGVPKKLIDTYTVYSSEVAQSMAQVITEYAKADYGIGITGKLNRADPNNLYGEDNVVFVSIYDKKKDSYTNFKVMATLSSRKKNKELVIQKVVEQLEEILLSKKG